MVYQVTWLLCCSNQEYNKMSPSFVTVVRVYYNFWQTMKVLSMRQTYRFARGRRSHELRVRKNVIWRARTYLLFQTEGLNVSTRSSFLSVFLSKIFDSVEWISKREREIPPSSLPKLLTFCAWIVQAVGCTWKTHEVLLLVDRSYWTQLCLSNRPFDSEW